MSRHHYEGIEPQFDLAAQEARAAARKPEGEAKPPYVYDRDAVIAASVEIAELSQKAHDLEALADEIEKEALEAERLEEVRRLAAAGEPLIDPAKQVEVPEAEKVEQEPEVALSAEQKDLLTEGSGG